jgi:hypothetical protein
VGLPRWEYNCLRRCSACFHPPASSRPWRAGCCSRGSSAASEAFSEDEWRGTQVGPRLRMSGRCYSVTQPLSCVSVLLLACIKKIRTLRLGMCVPVAPCCTAVSAVSALDGLNPNCGCYPQTPPPPASAPKQPLLVWMGGKNPSPGSTGWAPK